MSLPLHCEFHKDSSGVDSSLRWVKVARGVWGWEFIFFLVYDLIWYGMVWYDMLWPEKERLWYNIYIFLLLSIIFWDCTIIITFSLPFSIFLLVPVIVWTSLCIFYLRSSSWSSNFPPHKESEKICYLPIVWPCMDWNIYTPHTPQWRSHFCLF